MRCLDDIFFPINSLQFQRCLFFFIAPSSFFLSRNVTLHENTILLTNFFSFVPNLSRQENIAEYLSLSVWVYKSVNNRSSLLTELKRWNDRANSLCVPLQRRSLHAVCIALFQINSILCPSQMRAKFNLKLAIYIFL